MVKHLDSKGFEAFISTDETVIVDFHAEWCGPCKAMGPVLENASVKFPGKIGKIDVDKCPEIAAQFAVRSIPTLIVFKNSQVIGKRVGMVTKMEEISNLIV